MLRLVFFFLVPLLKDPYIYRKNLHYEIQFSGKALLFGSFF